jgi:hypothetical protein
MEVNMIPGHVTDYPLEEFSNFVPAWSSEAIKDYLGINADCLADYIWIWMKAGEGLYLCLGDREVFLTVVTAIIDKWTQEPEILDFVSSDPAITRVPRRPSSIFGKWGMQHLILSPHWFQGLVFHELHGSRMKS